MSIIKVDYGEISGGGGENILGVAANRVSDYPKWNYINDKYFQKTSGDFGKTAFAVDDITFSIIKPIDIVICISDSGTVFYAELNGTSIITTPSSGSFNGKTEVINLNAGDSLRIHTSSGYGRGDWFIIVNPSDDFDIVTV